MAGSTSRPSCSTMSATQSINSRTAPWTLTCSTSGPPSVACKYVLTSSGMPLLGCVCGHNTSATIQWIQAGGVSVGLAPVLFSADGVCDCKAPLVAACCERISEKRTHAAAMLTVAHAMPSASTDTFSKPKSCARAGMTVSHWVRPCLGPHCPGLRAMPCDIGRQGRST